MSSIITQLTTPASWITAAIKDVILIKDVLATGASAFLGNYQAPYSATIIDKLQAAGITIISKDNCDMFGHGSTTSNTAYGSVANALDPDYVAWWSSGGTAVNVALWYADIGIGSDTGGSIRQPEVYNWLVGFKPSYGVVSRYGLMAYASSLDTLWPICKNVEDINMVMNIIGGQDEHDMTSHSYEQLDDSQLSDYSLSGKKIGVYSDFLNYAWLASEVKTHMEEMMTSLQAQWAKIIMLDLMDPELLVASYYVIAMAETASNLSRLTGVWYGIRVGSSDFIEVAKASRAVGFSDETIKRIIIGNQILSTGDQAHYYRKAQIVRQSLHDAFAHNFESVDLVMSPVSPQWPDKIGATYSNDTYLNDMYTVGFSLAGLPTIALPTMHLNGIQITGKAQDDHQVLKAGKLIETLIK